MDKSNCTSIFWAQFSTHYVPALDILVNSAKWSRPRKKPGQVLADRTRLARLAGQYKSPIFTVRASYSHEQRTGGRASGSCRTYAHKIAKCQRYFKALYSPWRLQFPPYGHRLVAIVPVRILILENSYLQFFPPSGHLSPPILP